MGYTSPSFLQPGLLFRVPTRARERDASDLGRDPEASTDIVAPEARITVSRQSPQDVGFREIFVSIDGTSVGILRHGDSVTTEVPSGPHRVRVHNTLFWKTQELVLKPGEHARFNAVNVAGWGTFGILFILGAMPVYLTCERIQGDTPIYSTR
jgi:hypothetical protein